MSHSDPSSGVWPQVSELIALLRGANGGCVTYRLIEYQLWHRRGRRLPTGGKSGENPCRCIVWNTQRQTGLAIKHHIGVGYSLLPLTRNHDNHP